MTTIRQLITKAMEIKANYCNTTVDEAFEIMHLSIVFYSKNGVQFFVDMCPMYDKLNKNNVYRKIDIEIISGDYNAPRAIWNYGQIWSHNEHLLAKFNKMPERLTNELLSMNGGVDIDRFVTEFTAMWESFKQAS